MDTDAPLPPPRHVVSTRPLQGEERDQLRLPPPAKVDEWGCALAVLGTAALMGCGLGALLQVWFVLLARMSFLPFVTGLLLIAFAYRVARAIQRTTRETHARLEQDRAEDAAEVIEVWDPVAFAQEAHPDEGPIYLLDIGHGRLLVLCGPELREATVLHMGRPWPSTRAEERHDGEWPPPFLNSHFVLHRGRRSGRILRIDVLGEPVAVARTLPEDTLRVDGSRPSLIVDGTLDG
jgi:hypothetical protein